MNLNIFILVLGSLFILSLLINIKLLINNDKKSPFKKLKDLMTYKTVNGINIDLYCQPIENTPRVYVSASMFCLEDVIYAIGLGNLGSGKSYSAMDFPDIVCNLENDQIDELKKLCEIWGVPWYGIVGEIEKLGWEAYCPIRDGFPMSGALDALNNLTLDDIYNDENGNPEDNNSPYNPLVINNRIKNDIDYQKLVPKLDINNISDNDRLEYITYDLNVQLSISIGANDLFAMYSSCNCCIFNFNGIQADAGALAEIGNLGARGVPISIIKGQITSDFGGSNNPMPTMCSSSKSTVFPSLLSQNSGIYSGYEGALDHLKNKIKIMLENKNNISAYSNYNHDIPLPPLQIYWSIVGYLTYSLKHINKKIPTNVNGTVDYDKDYTQFWKDNVVNPKNTHKGWVNMTKKCAENIYNLMKDKKWRDIVNFWK